MKRDITNELIKWKNSENRKPLIIKGARQVGKTYVVKAFGEKYYDNYVYFNFDHDKDLKNIFANTKDPERILNQLRAISGSKIDENETLIFFDEVQECSDALNALKYFNEECMDYHIIAAGSLLGVYLSNTSFPVGKVDFLDMQSLTFDEFLSASSNDTLYNSLNNIKNLEDINILHERFMENLKLYYIIGGMPEVVSSWVNNKDIVEVKKYQNNIIESYRNDFSKHVSDIDANKISLVFDSIPSQLAKENDKFLYQVVKEGARAREYEYSLNWLINANILLKVNNVSTAQYPLKAFSEINAFKIYMADVGLLTNHAQIDSSFIKFQDFESTFKGKLTENFVLTHLNYVSEYKPFYYTFSNYEVDFLLQYKNLIIPVEVKSGKNLMSVSLKKYNEKYSPKLLIRISANKLKLDDNVLNIPIYLTGHINEIIDLALNFI